MASQKLTLSDKRTVLDAQLKDGNNLLATSPHGIKISASVKAGTIERITARDKNGQPVRVTLMRRNNTGTSPAECWVCIDTPGGQFCYQIDCGKLPPPKITASKR